MVFRGLEREREFGVKGKEFRERERDGDRFFEREREKERLGVRILDSD